MFGSKDLGQHSFNLQQFFHFRKCLISFSQASVWAHVKHAEHTWLKAHQTLSLTSADYTYCLGTADHRGNKYWRLVLQKDWTHLWLLIIYVSLQGKLRLTDKSLKCTSWVKYNKHIQISTLTLHPIIRDLISIPPVQPVLTERSAEGGPDSMSAQSQNY